LTAQIEQVQDKKHKEWNCWYVFTSQPPPNSNHYRSTV